jgi:hypothetical protein
MPGIIDTPDNIWTTANVPAQATAGSTNSWTLWRAPANVVVVGARWIPDTAVTGAATNNFALALTNVTASSAAVTTAKTYASGTNSVANTAESLTLSTATGVNVSTGDVIALTRTVNGTGLASPSGAVEITFRIR